MMNVQTEAALICVGVLAALLILFVGATRLLAWRREVASKPRLTIRAKVVSRTRLRRDGGSRELRQEPVSIRKRLNAGNPTYIDLDEYLHVCTAVFACEDGRAVTLRIPGRVYDVLRQGQQGWLTYQGSRFIRFEDDGKAADKG